MRSELHKVGFANIVDFSHGRRVDVRGLARGVADDGFYLPILEMAKSIIVNIRGI